jgi:hypothetical protein
MYHPGIRNWIEKDMSVIVGVQATETTEIVAAERPPLAPLPVQTTLRMGADWGFSSVQIRVIRGKNLNIFFPVFRGPSYQQSIPL